MCVFDSNPDSTLYLHNMDGGRYISRGQFIKVVGSFLSFFAEHAVD